MTQRIPRAFTTSGACSLGACSLLGFTLVAALLLGFLFGARIGVDGRKVDFSEYHRTLHAGRAAGCKHFGF